jgi:hypothetical protein
MSKLEAVISSAALLSGTGSAAADPGDSISAIILVHGAFVDGSGWSGVHQILEEDSYAVTVLQNPTSSLAEDVAATRRALAAAEESVVLVGHSYGGVVITEAVRSEGHGSRLCGRFRPRRRRVGFLDRRQCCARHSRPSDRAVGGRRSDPRPHALPRSVRDECSARDSPVYGGLAAAVGRESAY